VVLHRQATRIFQVAVALVLVGAAPLALSAKRCLQGAVQVHLGKLDRNPPEALRVGQDASVFRLGSGVAGGTVYRVVYPGRPARVLKHYKHAVNLSQDLDRFNVIDAQLKRAPPGGGERFRLARMSRLSDDVMEVEDVRGTSLETLLDSPDVSKHDRDILSEKYIACLDHLLALLRETHQQESLNSHGGAFRGIDSRGRYFSLFVRPANVIVTPEHEFVIIDPY
jgi:hypothetical protein